LWYFKNEAPMLIYRILFFGFQSRRLTKFHDPWVLHLKRFIMRDYGWISIMVENNILQASGKRLKLD
jgi:hypothetical protein